MSATPFTAEDLYLYSMHLLDAEEHQRLEAFLQRSSEARTELQHVRGDLACLALAVEQVSVPEVSKHRLLHQIAREPRAAVRTIAQPLTDVAAQPQVAAAVLDEASDPADRYTPASATPRIGQVYEDETPRRSLLAQLLPWAGWPIAAGLAFTTWTLHQRNVALGTEAVAVRASASAANEKSAAAETVLATLRSGSSQRFLLTAQDTPPVPSGRVTYLADAGSIVFQGNDLEAVPAGKTYELWLIPADKATKPLRAGTFEPDGKGYASLILPPLPKGVAAGTFGITMENVGGSDAPTLPILLVAPSNS